MLKSRSHQYRAGLAALSAAVLLSAVAARWNWADEVPAAQLAPIVAPCDEGLAGHMANSLSYTMDQRLLDLQHAALEAEYRNAHDVMTHEGEFLVRLDSSYRQDLDSKLQSQGCHMGKDFRMKPVLQDDRVHGFLIRVKSSHYMWALGFRDGDTLLACDGMPLVGREALSRLTGKLRDPNDRHFLIERYGKLHCLRVIGE